MKIHLEPVKQWKSGACFWLFQSVKFHWESVIIFSKISVKLTLDKIEFEEFSCAFTVEEKYMWLPVFCKLH